MKKLWRFIRVLIWFVAVVSVAEGALPSGVTLQDIDGGPNYYGSHGFTYAHNAGWDDSSFFPIGLWTPPMLDQSDASRWKDLGLNTGFTLTGNSNIMLLRSNGLWAILQFNELNRFVANMGTETVGLMSADEPGSIATGITTPLSTTANNLQDGRYWWFNNTWNFINYGDLERVPAATVLSTLVTTPNGTKRHIDVQGVDIYWFSGAKSSTSIVLYGGGLIYNLGRTMTVDEAARGCFYGDMVDRVRAFQTTYPAPIPQIIENGGPFNENTAASSYITPPELNWAVWSSIIHGARQIVYFNHSFAGPAQSQDNLRETYYKTIQSGQTISIYNQTKATNALVRQLAPAINSPTAIGYVTVNPAPTTFAGIETMAKYNNGQFYIFADTRASESATNIAATFTIKNTNAASVTVVNENRTLPISNGTTFTDTFAKGSTVHIYMISTSNGVKIPCTVRKSELRQLAGHGKICNISGRRVVSMHDNAGHIAVVVRDGLTKSIVRDAGF
jgi:hypothetical protein